VQYGERGALRWIALSSVLVAAASLLFVPFGLATRPYAMVATVCDVAFVALAARGLIDHGSRFEARRWAKGVFGASILYLSVLLAALLLCRVAP